MRFSVRVQPPASKSEIAGLHGASRKVCVTARPVDGLANEAQIDFLSEALEISRRKVCIVSGHFSRTKVVEISGVDLATVQRLAD